MRPKQLTESELFRKLNILLLDRNKEQLEEIKEKASLLADVEIDNSGLIRGIIHYFFENQDELKKVVPYVKEAKGYNILMQFNEMMDNDKSAEEIEQELGIGKEIFDKVTKKHFQ